MSRARSEGGRMGMAHTLRTQALAVARAGYYTRILQ